MGPQPKDVKGFFILIKSLLLVMLLLGTSGSLVFAEELVKNEAKESLHEIRVVELKHRSASQILEAIKPHLAPNTAAIEQNQNLIISGEAAKLEQLELLINALDEPVQAWRVIFSQGQVNHQQAQQTSGRHYSTARSDVFELLVREGAAARLERGFWIPVETGVGQYRTKAYEWLSSGIWVTVKPVGDQLILNLSTQEAKQERTSSLQTPRFSGLLTSSSRRRLSFMHSRITPLRSGLKRWLGSSALTMILTSLHRLVQACGQLRQISLSSTRC